MLDRAKGFRRLPRVAAVRAVAGRAGRLASALAGGAARRRSDGGPRFADRSAASRLPASRERDGGTSPDHLRVLDTRAPAVVRLRPRPGAARGGSLHAAPSRSASLDAGASVPRSSAPCSRPDLPVGPDRRKDRTPRSRASSPEIDERHRGTLARPAALDAAALTGGAHPRRHGGVSGRWRGGPTDHDDSSVNSKRSPTAARCTNASAVGCHGNELARLDETLNAMIARLENSLRRLRRFTADASHELKTPLTVLRATSSAR